VYIEGSDDRFLDGL